MSKWPPAHEEFFIIKAELYKQRPDLVNCGRTLIGKLPCRHQQGDLNYFAPPPQQAPPHRGHPPKLARITAQHGFDTMKLGGLRCRCIRRLGSSFVLSFASQWHQSAI